MGHEAQAPMHLPTPLAVHTADEAIALVLQREREAAQALRAAQTDAARQAEGARAQAQALAQRIDRRLQRLVAAFESAARRQVAALAAQTDEAGQAPVLDEAERDRLARTVRALATELTTPAGGGGP